MDMSKFVSMTKDFKPSLIIHFSALLSGTSETNFEKAIDVNLHGFLHAIKCAEEVNSKIFVPSSIAAYGFMDPEDRINVDEKSQLRPKNIYGITKLFGELVGYYLHQKRNLDFRSLRYPGVLSSILPSGGTTDFANQMIYDAVTNKKTHVFLDKDVKLPFIFIEDLIFNTVL